MEYTEDDYNYLMDKYENWDVKQQPYFSEVRDKFTDLDIENIIFTYQCDWIYSAGIDIIDVLEYIETKKIIRRPEIFLGLMMPARSIEVQKGILAHELGHYRMFKDFNDLELTICADNALDAMTISQNTMPDIKKLSEERKKEVILWSRINEFYADEQAFKAGYGQALLDDLKDVENEDITDLGLKEMEYRADNIERLLKNN